VQKWYKKKLKKQARSKSVITNLNSSDVSKRWLRVRNTLLLFFALQIRSCYLVQAIAGKVNQEPQRIEIYCKLFSMTSKTQQLATHGTTCLECVCVRACVRVSQYGHYMYSNCAPIKTAISIIPLVEKIRKSFPISKKVWSHVAVKLLPEACNTEIHRFWYRQTLSLLF
jgi:hypothetical protein